MFTLVIPSNIQQTLQARSPLFPVPQINALVLTERGGQHEGFVVAALEWLHGFENTHSFSYTECNHASEITENSLRNFNVIIQLDYPPYSWTDSAEAAFIDYIEKGPGAWIGFHHATLLGEFDDYPMWNWFSNFMGGIRFDNYIAPLASGTVHVEDTEHPVMKGVSKTFTIPNDEWYTFDNSPRPHVHVLANVDESSYDPPSEIKMGDHPVIWVNEEKKARNVYFLMGHHSDLFESENFVKMFGNAILWAAGF